MGAREGPVASAERCLGKRVRQTLDDLGDEVIARTYSFLGIIDKV